MFPCICQVCLSFCMMMMMLLRMQVLASPSKIYIVLEFVTGGELFDRIVCHFILCHYLKSL